MALEGRKEIRMWCDTAGRAVYLENIDWSALGLRERSPGETIHLRDEPDERCRACGILGGVWVSADSSHATHRDKCR